MDDGERLVEEVLSRLEMRRAPHHLEVGQKPVPMSDNSFLLKGPGNLIRRCPFFNQDKLLLLREALIGPVPGDVRSGCHPSCNDDRREKQNQEKGS